MSWTARIMATMMALILLGLNAVEASDFKVVVNSNNPLSSIEKSELSSIYLKRKTHWSSGREITFVDQKASAPARDAFLAEVLGRDAVWVNNHWAKVVFTGRGTPPQMLAGDREVLEFVRSNEGAVGFVSEAASLGSGVKEVQISQ